MNQLSRTAYEELRREHRAQLEPIVHARRQRRSIGQKDPVIDFLFEYYSHPSAKLLRWSPGSDTIIADIEPENTDFPYDFVVTTDGCCINSERFSQARLPYLRWAIDYLQTIQQREPFFGCFGLHEWAMVYKATTIRHDRIPLRLSREATDAFTETWPIHCSHYDAFRFFTPEGRPLNRRELSRESTIEHDQPACIHVNMDLYKFCYKIAPFGSSILMRKAFQHALQCRQVDMQASPYDLQKYDIRPLCIDTREGREKYVAMQRELTIVGMNLREEVLAEYRLLHQRLTSTKPMRLTDVSA